MFHDIKQYSEEELKKIRGEILAWIEKNEKKKGNKEGIKKTAIKNKAVNFDSEKKTLEKTVKVNNFTFSNKLKWAVYSLVIVVVVILMDILGIYVFHIKNPAFVSLNKFMPFQAMKINSMGVSYFTYMHDIEKLRVISSMRLNELIWYDTKNFGHNIFLRYELLNFLQKKYSLPINYSVARADSIKLYEKYTSDKSSILKDRGITIDDIEQFIILPQMIKEKLLQKYQKESPAWSEGKKNVEKFIDNIKNNGVNYEEARQNIDNSIVIIENDMGFIEKGVSSYAFDGTLFDLPLDGISSLYEDERGLHVYMITDRFMEINMIKVKDIIFLPEFDFEKVFASDTKNIIIKNYIE